MINYAEPYKVVFEDHTSEVPEVIGRFDCPHKAKKVASEFNALLSRRMPVTEGNPFPFYYVHTELKSGTLPWIASLVDPATVTMAGQSDPCVRCKVRAGQYGRRGMCVRCHREVNLIKKGVV